MKKEWTGERLETGIHSRVTTEHLHRYALAMEFVNDKLVLDIACGEGYGVNLLAQKAKTVTGVDIDRDTIKKAREKYRKQNITFLEGAVQSIPLQDQSVDIVTSFETLEHTDKHQQFLKEIKRVLRPAGLLVISTPDKKWYSDHPGYTNPFHAKELYRAEFETLLNSHFTNVQIAFQQFFCGSMILSRNDQMSFYSGDFDGIKNHDQAEAPYMIALASDGELPVFAQTYFNASDIMDQAVSQKELDIKNSMSYRLGSFILAPAKWLNKLLKRS